MSLPTPDLDIPEKQVIITILNAVEEISYFLRHSPIVLLQTFNKFGDQQLKQDIHCDELAEAHLRKNPLIRGFASQERPEYYQISKGTDGYIVTYDPIDGSSIIDTNFAVGSIFSIWPYTEQKLINKKVNNQINALLAVYGPRTTVIYYNSKLGKVQELTLVQKSWILSHDHIIIKPGTNIYSPGNCRAAEDNKLYEQKIYDWMKRGFTLRYSGGLVPDVQQILIKASEKHKAKLRVLYEAAAVGFLVQKAEGSSITHVTYDDRITFAVGSKNEVQLFKNIFSK